MIHRCETGATRSAVSAGVIDSRSVFAHGLFHTTLSHWTSKWVYPPWVFSIVSKWESKWSEGKGSQARSVNQSYSSSRQTNSWHRRFQSTWLLASPIHLRPCIFSTIKWIEYDQVIGCLCSHDAFKFQRMEHRASSAPAEQESRRCWANHRSRPQEIAEGSDWRDCCFVDLMSKCFSRARPTAPRQGINSLMS